MQDKELYQHILGLTSPWTVSEVKLDIPAEEIQVRVEHPAGTKFSCPECQKELACYDHAEERRWRYLENVVRRSGERRSQPNPLCGIRGWAAMKQERYRFGRQYSQTHQRPICREGGQFVFHVLYPCREIRH